MGALFLYVREKPGGSKRNFGGGKGMMQVKGMIQVKCEKE